jgi:hypothetical protein
MGTAGYVPNFKAGSTVYPFRVVRMDTSAAFTAIPATDSAHIVLGVTDGSTRAFDSTEHAAAGGTISLQNSRFVQVQSNGTIVVGDLLKASTAGLVEKIGTGERAFLQACDNAASGEILWAFRVQTWEI